MLKYNTKKLLKHISGTESVPILRLKIKGLAHHGQLARS